MNAPAFARPGFLERAGVGARGAPVETAPTPVKATVHAPHVVELQPDAFARDWTDRPTEPVRVGLRLVSLAAVERARAEAARIAWEMHREDRDNDQRVDCFNDAIMREVLLAATCQPDDVAKPYWDIPENLKGALSVLGVRELWEGYQRLEASASVLTPEATDEQLAALAKLLTSGATWERLPPVEAASLRRLMTHALVRLGA